MTVTVVVPLRQLLRPAPHVPRHRAPYDEAMDRARKNGTHVPARHSYDPDSTRAVIPR